MSAPHIMIVAGETSGDLLGADLIEAIRALYPDAVFSGVGGPTMMRKGFSSLFDMSEVAIMGLGPILANLRRLFGLVDLTASHACDTRPDVVVLIDSPEFNHRVAARIKKRHPDICVICYVAPRFGPGAVGGREKWRSISMLCCRCFRLKAIFSKRLPGHLATLSGIPLLIDFKVTRRLQIFEPRTNSRPRENFCAFYPAAA